ncbi:MAG TPA: proline--tRNA ligase [Acidobacteriota bacterium]|nr:proline--tRNA ligase [Acidobacteriota bacterium]
MLWSRLFIPTLREVPADAEVASHKLLLRAGFIRQLGAGLYSYLPLAWRSLLKIESIVREEMNRIGAQEFHLPALHPAEIWKESGRWDVMGENMFRLKDRTGRDMCLGMTHEEVFSSLARELRSYRDLPQIWYQIQVKFRDEPRPKSGLLRVRQFIMKDSYSFDLEPAGLDKAYELHDQAYRKIFERCGLRYLAVEAHSGAMGGSESQEFMVVSDAGEDTVVLCSKCGYAANLERAESELAPLDDDARNLEPEKVHTPGQKTIQEVSDFLQIPKWRQIKSLVYLVDSKPYLLLVRGDHQLNEAKLEIALGSGTFRPAVAEEIREFFGADPGSLGPVGVKSMPILADLALKGRKNMVCGANQDDYHLLNVTPEEDFQAEFHDLRQVEAGELCPKCRQPLEVANALEVGHIFKLGYKYSKSMGVTVLNQDGTEIPIIMGSYGIGLERILVAAVELYNDETGIIWPRPIAPFEVIVTVMRRDDPEQFKTAMHLHDELARRGIDCLLDDRDERPGVKFNDAELIGIPIRITVGKKLSDGIVEIFTRNDKANREVSAARAVEEAIALLDAYPLSPVNR